MLSYSNKTTTLMNGNDESTASMQPSGGSVVDGPSASNISSPSSNGGARTTTSEDDAVSQPNGETQLSDQMQQLNIGQNANIQSNPSSLPELRAYCQSDSISLDRLRSIFIKKFFLYYLGHPLDCTTYDYDILLVDICKNEHVTYEMVQCVIEHVPGAASVKTTGGFTPLHFLCMNKNVTQEIVRCVIGGNSDALLAQDEFGMTPLFSLCHNRAVDETVAEEILTLFLETCPESAQCCTHDGDLPIHFACRRRSPDFCCMLIQKFPESIQHEVEGMPVVYYVLFSSDVNDSVALAVLKMLLEDHPRMVRYVRWNGQSLLNYAASNHLPRAVEVCRLLIQAFRGLVLELDESTDDLYLQPLHTACHRGNLPVVECILDMHPDAIRGESSDGSFPIHYAVHALTRTPQAAVEVVKNLLSVDPSVASQEVNGITNAYPLINVCVMPNVLSWNAGLEVIKLLYNAYPEAIVNAEEIFRRGIDISHFVDAVRDFINEQLRYATQASNLQLVRTQDGNGRLPLHHALEEVAPWGAIKLLVQADPATLQIPDSEGSLPLHIAASK
mmetsp:Transcript_17423/g.29528  ORF Transcript_17423/g.29528 Transcript_17423/m.29528 type:complete len:558 (+) Transcript_17423:261-1934(+)